MTVAFFELINQPLISNFFSLRLAFELELQYHIWSLTETVILWSCEMNGLTFSCIYISLPSNGYTRSSNTKVMESDA